MAQSTFSTMFGLTEPTKNKPLIDNGLLEDEFAPHFHAWKDEPNSVNTGKLLKAVDPVIKSALRTYTGQGQSSPTLRSQAKLAVLDSLPRYDMKRAKLRTYLMTNLQSLRRAAAEEQQIVSVPERVRLDQQRLRDVTSQLADKLNREPSDGELAKHTGLSLRRLEHIRKAKGSLAEGQLEGVPGDDGQAGDVATAVMPRGRDTYLRFIHGDLSPIDQFIMEHSLGMHGKAVLLKGVIAKKLGISAGAVSQRAAKIQSILDRHESMKISVL